MSCDLILDPGRPPEVVLPAEGSEGQLLAWCSIEEVLLRDCRFSVGPEVPGQIPGPPLITTTVPYEIIGTKGPTGRSLLEAIGMATWFIHTAGVQQGITKYGLRRVTIRPCLCSCAKVACICKSVLDSVALPRDTCEIVRVLIDGLPLVSRPPETISSVSSPYLSGVGTSVLQVSSYPVSSLTSYTTVDSFGVTHQRTFSIQFAPHLTSPAINAGGIVGNGTAASYTFAPRPAYRIAKISGQLYAVRLDQRATCDSDSCPCASATSDSAWPRKQRLDLPESEPCTWSITIQQGCPVPPAGRRAVAELAASLAKEIAGEECDVPDGLRSLARDGATWQEVRAEVYRGAKHFGIEAVAQWFGTAEKSQRRTAGFNLPVSLINRR